MRLVTNLIREAGADDLLTSYFPEGDGTPGPFYERLGFAPTGAVDDNGEIILRLDLRSTTMREAQR